jgi:hypothetical protein
MMYNHTQTRTEWLAKVRLSMIALDCKDIQVHGRWEKHTVEFLEADL